MLRFICLLLKILLCIVQGLLGFLWSLIKRREEPNFTCDIALITGGAQGLGRELALLFSSAGATVVIWDINEEKLRQTVSEITARGREAFGYVVDLSNREEVKRGAERVREEVGNVSILINNVGVLPGKLLKEFKDGEFEKTITVNFLSHYWTIQAFLPWMLDNDYGRIVEIASFSSFTGGPFVSDYNASKAALSNFSESLHYELYLTGKRGVKVTCICPWAIDTGLIPARFNSLFPDTIVTKLSPAGVAQQVLSAVSKGKFMVVVPQRMFLSAVFALITPRRIKDLVIGTYVSVKEDEGEEEGEELSEVVHYKKS